MITVGTGKNGNIDVTYLSLYDFLGKKACPKSYYRPTLDTTSKMMQRIQAEQTVRRLCAGFAFDTFVRLKSCAT